MTQLILVGLLALFLQTNATSSRVACAADYSSCGSSLPSPIGNLPCCNASFYCYTHGPYFSQCRPIHETDPNRDARLVHKSLCGRNYGVCSAGSAADTRLKCCDPNYVCVPTTSLFWQCVPEKSRWYEVQVGRTTKRSYTDKYTAEQVKARPLTAEEKIVWETRVNGLGLNVFLPLMSRKERAEFENVVRHIDGVRDVDRGVAVVFVSVDRALEDVARKIAEMTQVGRVEVV